MSSLRTLVVLTALAAGRPDLSGAAAIADAVLWGREMPASALSAALPRHVQSQVVEYREREKNFHSALTPPRQGLPEMPRREARFIDRLLADLPKPWLAPYLNLIAGHRKLCASEMDGAAADARSRELTEDARRQLVRARDGSNNLIRIVASRLLTTGRCM